MLCGDNNTITLYFKIHNPKLCDFFSSLGIDLSLTKINTITNNTIFTLPNGEQFRANNLCLENVYLFKDLLNASLWLTSLMLSERNSSFAISFFELLKEKHITDTVENLSDINLRGFCKSLTIIAETDTYLENLFVERESGFGCKNARAELVMTTNTVYRETTITLVDYKDTLIKKQKHLTLFAYTENEPPKMISKHSNIVIPDMIMEDREKIVKLATNYGFTVHDAIEPYINLVICDEEYANSSKPKYFEYGIPIISSIGFVDYMNPNKTKTDREILEKDDYHHTSFNALILFYTHGFGYLYRKKLSEEIIEAK